MRRLSSGSRTRSLSSQLKRLAIEKGPGFQFPTTRELCQQFGASSVTINNALNELEVKNIIERRDRFGIFVSPNIHRKSIDILLANTLFMAAGSSPFWGQLWGILSNETDRRSDTCEQDFHFHVLRPAKGNAEILPAALTQRIEVDGVDGIIGIGVRGDGVTWIEEHGVPYAAYAGPGSHNVAAEPMQNLREGVRVLAESGCRRIAYWSPVTYRNYPDDMFVYDPAALHAFQSCLKDAGLTYFEELVRDYAREYNVRQVSTHQEQGYDAVMSVFRMDRTQWPDGIVATDDMMTSGALTAFEQLGLKAGRDVTIATHANKGSTVLFGREAQLILLEFDPQEIVNGLFTLLDRQMEGTSESEEIIQLSPTVRRPDTRD